MTAKSEGKRALTGDGISDVVFIEEEIPTLYVRLKGVYKGGDVSFEEMVEWGDAVNLFATFAVNKSSGSGVFHFNGSPISIVQTKQGPITFDPWDFTYLRVLANADVSSKFMSDVNSEIARRDKCAKTMP